MRYDIFSVACGCQHKNESLAFLTVRTSPVPAALPAPRQDKPPPKQLAKEDPPPEESSAANVPPAEPANSAAIAVAAEVPPKQVESSKRSVEVLRRNEDEGN
eukprot:GHVS01079228.1.p2 GENE.GHVS01079228.1~~GHVS01079228.1.p2  ORF type:complete len:102 (+),score=24.99 GHVS01079228.1:276-581(+)